MNSLATLLAISALVLVTSPTASATSLDWRDICFRAGHPTAGEGLISAVEPPFGEQLENFRVNLEILSTYRNVRYDVIGHVSKFDCHRGGCVEISQRRAKLVHEYLVEHGTPTKQLNAPIGVGTNLLHAPDDSERAVNRCVELRVTLDPEPAK